MGSYDLSNPQSFNRYTYARNNPLTLVDPLGLDPNCTAESGEMNPGCQTGTYMDQNGNYWFYDANTGHLSSLSTVVNVSGSGDSDFVYSSSNSMTTLAGGGGSGGGGTPNNTKKQSVRQCADDIANHWSIAGMLPGGVGVANNFTGGVLSGLLGNSIAGFSDLYSQATGTSENGMGNLYGGQFVGGLIQGLPIRTDSLPAGVKGPVNVLLEQASESVQTAALNIGRAKIALDLAVYGAALSYCSTGKY